MYSITCSNCPRKCASSVSTYLLVTSLSFPAFCIIFLYNIRDPWEERNRKILSFKIMSNGVAFPEIIMKLYFKFSYSKLNDIFHKQWWQVFQNNEHKFLNFSNHSRVMLPLFILHATYMLHTEKHDR